MFWSYKRCVSFYEDSQTEFQNGLRMVYSTGAHLVNDKTQSIVRIASSHLVKIFILPQQCKFEEYYFALCPKPLRKFSQLFSSRIINGGI